MGKTLVLGVGNVMRRDDGVGPKIIERLKGAVSVKNSPSFLDGGTDGLALLDVIKAYDYAIIIDAVNMGEKPGTIKVFLPNEAKIKIQEDALSTHGFGLAEVLKLAETLEIKTKIKIIGIQPETIEFGEGLSEALEKQLDFLIEKILSLY